LFHFFSSQYKNITNVLNTTLDKFNAKDPETMQQLSTAAGTIDPAIIENYRKQLISQIKDSKEHIANDPKSEAENYASAIPSWASCRPTWGKPPMQ
jgi:hypothetical protein